MPIMLLITILSCCFIVCIAYDDSGDAILGNDIFSSNSDDTDSYSSEYTSSDNSENIPTLHEESDHSPDTPYSILDTDSTNDENSLSDNSVSSAVTESPDSIPTSDELVTTTTTTVPLDLKEFSSTTPKPETQTQPTFDFLGERNSAIHYTDKFKIDDYSKYLVLRRGLNFEFKIHWNHECDTRSKIGLFLKLNTFKDNNKLSFEIFANDHWNQNEWYLMYSCENGVADLIVNIPINASIGSFGVKLIDIINEKRNEYILHRNIAIIFNPYYDKDTVYMDKNDLKEYIENDVGLMWIGSTYKQSPRPWLFGQVDAYTALVIF
ncbi:Hemocyte protein-glutamine gamma-glutamyltransferase-like protein [Leptotrombidium deliense]|uniref:Hemocyte protein-glutamine gamma-glutamyltransferase-like protein n=1 Tax=Leptotrombidium deliense TaxID=299467 RepID=A0A443SIQ1_9ACAR|nr:Hemocyte protein-glutamine gamma-glutamyltransferase-like protein [Leptotrombidium deliense]